MSVRKLAAPVGDLLAIRRDAIGFLERLAGEGDVVQFRLGRQRVFLVNDLAAVQDVLVRKSKVFFHETVVRPRWLRSGAMPRGEGLAATAPELHLRARRLLQPAFNPELASTQAVVGVRRGAELRERWRDGETLDIDAEMARLVFGIVAEALYGVGDETRLKGVADEIRSLMVPFQLTPFLPLDLPRSGFPRAVRAMIRINAELAALVEDRKERKTGGNDVASILAAAYGTDRGRPPQDARTILTAGQVTGGAVLAWTWYSLSQHPDVEAQLHTELDSVLQGRLPTLEDLPRLAFTRRVAAETLRLYPPNWYIGRRAAADTELDGQRIPAHSFVIVSPYLVHRDPRNYPEPERFETDRWTEEAQAGRPKLAFMPFGAGARRCIAERFAWAEHVLLTATIAQRWRLRLVPGHQVELHAGAGLQPKNGLPMRIERR